MKKTTTSIWKQVEGKLSIDSIPAVQIDRGDDWRNYDWRALCEYLGAAVTSSRLAHLAKTAQEEFGQSLRGHTLLITYSLTEEGKIKQDCTRPATLAEAVQNAEAAARGDESL